MKIISPSHTQRIFISSSFFFFFSRYNLRILILPVPFLFFFSFFDQFHTDVNPVFNFKRTGGEMAIHVLRRAWQARSTRRERKEEKLRMKQDRIYWLHTEVHENKRYKRNWKKRFRQMAHKTTYIHTRPHVHLSTYWHKHLQTQTISLSQIKVKK